MEADVPEALAIQKRLLLSQQRIGRDQLPELVDVDIRLIFRVVAPAAEIAVGLLLHLHVPQQLLHLRHQR